MAGAHVVQTSASALEALVILLLELLLEFFVLPTEF
jgi:hypothetical protein